jgi:uncharacterized damage-inducible protein DinB
MINMDNEALLRNAFLDNILRYLIEENFPRVIKCLDMLSEEQVWYRPNAQSNSVGNLVIHLHGNLTQWVLDGIGGQPFKRARQAEFDADRTKTKAELIAMLGRLKDDLSPLIRDISTAELLSIRPVQIYEESGVTILVHVTEHFSYHCGQIAYLTKWLTGQPTNFYGPLE